MGLGYLIYQLGVIYTFIILIYCIFTWIPTNTSGVLSDVKGFFAKITEPYLNLFRKLIPPIGGTVDVTPIIAVVVLQLVCGLVARIF